jgi:hypothetical protein
MTLRTRGSLPIRAAVVAAVLAAAALWVDRPSGAQGVAIDRGSRDYTLPEQLKWRETENGLTANVYGDPAKPGLYAYILKRRPNGWSKPHFHDHDRFVTVLEGTFWAGTGAFDPQRTVPLKAGSFVRDVAGGIHFDGAKDDGATLYFVGIGPSMSQPAEPGARAASPPGSQVIDPAIRQVRHVEDMPKESFYLHGDPTKPGLYVQYLRRAADNWSQPHYHPIDRVVMVLGGTMFIGTGPSGDRARTVGVPKGGFIRDIARGVHYDGSGKEPLWIQIAGVGPTASISVDPPK